MNTYDSDGERRLWVYVAIGHPTTPPNVAANTLSFLSKIRDLDGDGISEIAIGCADSVVAVNGRNGGVIWRIWYSNVHALRTISISDADYIIVRYYDVNDCHLSLLSAVDGKALWSRITISTGWTWYNTLVIPDQNGDGWDDICVAGWAVGRSRGEIACISGATGSTLWGINLTYSVGAMTLVKSPRGDAALAVTTGTDNDGALSLLDASNGEVVWSTYLPAFEWVPIITYSESTDLLFASTILENGSRLAAYDPKDGEVVWEIPFPRVWQLLQLPDLDGDDRSDLLANVWEDSGPVIALSSSSGSTIWSSRLDTPFRPEPAALVGDVDGDGVTDIAVGTGLGRGIVYLLSGASGKVLWDFSAFTDVQSDINDILAPGDLNGDGLPDLVATSWDQCVYALSSLVLPETIDTEPPAISNVTFSPSSQRISVSASITEALSGIRMALIFYSSDGGVKWVNITMTTPIPPSTIYEGTMPAQAPNYKIQFYIEAMDAWGNIARSPIQEYTAPMPFWVYGLIGSVIVLFIVILYRRRAY